MVSEDILRDGVISGAGEVTYIPKNLVEQARGHWCEWKQSLELGGVPRERAKPPRRGPTGDAEKGDQFS